MNTVVMRELLAANGEVYERQYLRPGAIEDWTVRLAGARVFSEKLGAKITIGNMLNPLINPGRLATPRARYYAQPVHLVFEHADGREEVTP